MEVIYLLLPISLIVVAGMVWLFLWSIRSGQYDDLEGPAHRILMDDDRPESLRRSQDKKKPDEEKGA